MPKTNGPLSDDETSLRRRVKDAIVCQHLAPSQKVTEIGITETFATTRTVARSLIEQLTAQNFLVAVSPRITRVAPLTVLSIKENFLLRKLLLPELTAMCVLDVDIDQVAGLNRMITETEVDTQIDASVLNLLRLNRDYNLALVGNFKMPLPLEWVKLLEDMAMRIYWLYVKQQSALPFTATDHDTLMDAILSNDRDRVRSIAYKALDQSENRILDAIFANDQFFSHDLVL